MTMPSMDGSPAQSDLVTRVRKRGYQWEIERETARFWARTRREGTCLVWIGQLDRKGYGTVMWRCRRRGAHRLAYELTHGPVPNGMELDHLCRNPKCVDPAHLEVVTHRTNTLRSTSFVATNAAKTHCANGHAFTEENTYVSRTGRRACRECHRLLERARWHRRHHKREQGDLFEGTLTPVGALVGAGV